MDESPSQYRTPLSPPPRKDDALVYWLDESPPNAEEPDEAVVISALTAGSPVMTPASEAVSEALDTFSIGRAHGTGGPRRQLGFDTPEAATPMTTTTTTTNPRVRGQRRRLLFDQSAQTVPQVIKPGTPAPVALFEVYDDGPGTLHKQTWARPSGLPVPIIVARQAGNTRVAARSFSMESFNLRKDNKPTVAIRTHEPIVSELEGTGRYRVRFTANALREAEDIPKGERGKPLGIVHLWRSEFPGSLASRRETGTELMTVEPVFVALPTQHVTLVLASARPSVQPDHFVLELIHGSGRPLVRLAIAKAVMTALLFRDQSDVRLHSIPVTPTMVVSLVISVRRMRSSAPSKDRIPLAIEHVEWIIPEGFDATGTYRESE